MPVKYQICEQALNTLHHINRAKLLTENFAMAGLHDILWGGGQLTPEIHSSDAHFTKLRMGQQEYA